MYTWYRMDRPPPRRDGPSPSTGIHDSQARRICALTQATNVTFVQGVGLVKRSGGKKGFDVPYLQSQFAEPQASFVRTVHDNTSQSHGILRVAENRNADGSYHVMFTLLLDWTSARLVAPEMPLHYVQMLQEADIYINVVTNYLGTALRIVEVAFDTATRPRDQFYHVPAKINPDKREFLLELCAPYDAGKLYTRPADNNTLSWTESTWLTDTKDTRYVSRAGAKFNYPVFVLRTIDTLVPEHKLQRTLEPYELRRNRKGHDLTYQYFGSLDREEYYSMNVQTGCRPHFVHVIGGCVMFATHGKNRLMVRTTFSPVDLLFPSIPDPQNADHPTVLASQCSAMIRFVHPRAPNDPNRRAWFLTLVIGNDIYDIPLMTLYDGSGFCEQFDGSAIKTQDAVVSLTESYVSVFGLTVPAKRFASELSTENARRELMITDAYELNFNVSQAVLYINLTTPAYLHAACFVHIDSHQTNALAKWFKQTDGITDVMLVSRGLFRIALETANRLVVHRGHDYPCVVVSLRAIKRPRVWICQSLRSRVAYSDTTAARSVPSTSGGKRKTAKMLSCTIFSPMLSTTTVQPIVDPETGLKPRALPWAPAVPMRLVTNTIPNTMCLGAIHQTYSFGTNERFRLAMCFYRRLFADQSTKRVGSFARGDTENADILTWWALEHYVPPQQDANGETIRASTSVVTSFENTFFCRFGLSDALNKQTSDRVFELAVKGKASVHRQTNWEHITLLLNNAAAGGSLFEVGRSIVQPPTRDGGGNIIAVELVYRPGVINPRVADLTRLWLIPTSIRDRALPSEKDKTSGLPVLRTSSKSKAPTRLPLTLRLRPLGLHDALRTSVWKLKDALFSAVWADSKIRLSIQKFEDVERVRSYKLCEPLAEQQARDRRIMANNAVSEQCVIVGHADTMWLVTKGGVYQAVLPTPASFEDVARTGTATGGLAAVDVLSYAAIEVATAYNAHNSFIEGQLDRLLNPNTLDTAMASFYKATPVKAKTTKAAAARSSSSSSSDTTLMQIESTARTRPAPATSSSDAGDNQQQNDMDWVDSLFVDRNKRRATELEKLEKEQIALAKRRSLEDQKNQNEDIPSDGDEDMDGSSGGSDDDDDDSKQDEQEEVKVSLPPRPTVEEVNEKAVAAGFSPDQPAPLAAKGAFGRYAEKIVGTNSLYYPQPFYPEHERAYSEDACADVEKWAFNNGNHRENLDFPARKLLTAVNSTDSSYPGCGVRADQVHITFHNNGGRGYGTEWIESEVIAAYMWVLQRYHEFAARDNPQFYFIPSGAAHMEQAATYRMAAKAQWNREKWPAIFAKARAAVEADQAERAEEYQDWAAKRLAYEKNESDVNPGRWNGPSDDHDELFEKHGGPAWVTTRARQMSRKARKADDPKLASVVARTLFAEDLLDPLFRTSPLAEATDRLVAPRDPRALHAIRDRELVTPHNWSHGHWTASRVLLQRDGAFVTYYDPIKGRGTHDEEVAQVQAWAVKLHEILFPTEQRLDWQKVVVQDWDELGYQRYNWECGRFMMLAARSLVVPYDPALNGGLKLEDVMSTDHIVHITEQVLLQELFKQRIFPEASYITPPGWKPALQRLYDAKLAQEADRNELLQQGEREFQWLLGSRDFYKKLFKPGPKSPVSSDFDQRVTVRRRYGGRMSPHAEMSVTMPRTKNDGAVSEMGGVCLMADACSEEAFILHRCLPTCTPADRDSVVCARFQTTTAPFDRVLGQRRAISLLVLRASHTTTDPTASTSTAKSRTTTTTSSTRSIANATAIDGCLVIPTPLFFAIVTFEVEFADHTTLASLSASTSLQLLPSRHELQFTTASGTVSATVDEWPQELVTPTDEEGIAVPMHFVRVSADSGATHARPPTHSMCSCDVEDDCVFHTCGPNALDVVVYPSLPILQITALPDTDAPCAATWTEAGLVVFDGYESLRVYSDTIQALHAPTGPVTRTLGMLMGPSVLSHDGSEIPLAHIGPGVTAISCALGMPLPVLFFDIPQSATLLQFRSVTRLAYLMAVLGGYTCFVRVVGLADGNLLFDDDSVTHTTRLACARVHMARHSVSVRPQHDIAVMQHKGVLIASAAASPHAFEDLSVFHSPVGDLPLFTPRFADRVPRMRQAMRLTQEIERYNSVTRNTLLKEADEWDTGLVSFAPRDAALSVSADNVRALRQFAKVALEATRNGQSITLDQLAQLEMKSNEQRVRVLLMWVRMIPSVAEFAAVCGVSHDDESTEPAFRAACAAIYSQVGPLLSNATTSQVHRAAVCMLRHFVPSQMANALRMVQGMATRAITHVQETVDTTFNLSVALEKLIADASHAVSLWAPAFMARATLHEGLDELMHCVDSVLPQAHLSQQQNIELLGLRVCLAQHALRVLLHSLFVTEVSLARTVRSASATGGVSLIELRTALDECGLCTVTSPGVRLWLRVLGTAPTPGDEFYYDALLLAQVDRYIEQLDAMVERVRENGPVPSWSECCGVHSRTLKLPESLSKNLCAMPMISPVSMDVPDGLELEHSSLMTYLQQVSPKARQYIGHVEKAVLACSTPTLQPRAHMLSRMRCFMHTMLTIPDPLHDGMDRALKDVLRECANLWLCNRRELLTLRKQEPDSARAQNEFAVAYCAAFVVWWKSQAKQPDTIRVLLTPTLVRFYHQRLITKAELMFGAQLPHAEHLRDRMEATLSKHDDAKVHPTQSAVRMLRHLREQQTEGTLLHKSIDTVLGPLEAALQSSKATPEQLQTLTQSATQMVTRATAAAEVVASIISTAPTTRPELATWAGLTTRLSADDPPVDDVHLRNLLCFCNGALQYSLEKWMQDQVTGKLDDPDRKLNEIVRRWAQQLREVVAEAKIESPAVHAYVQQRIDQVWKAASCYREHTHRATAPVADDAEALVASIAATLDTFEAVMHRQKLPQPATDAEVVSALNMDPKKLQGELKEAAANPGSGAALRYDSLAPLAVTWSLQHHLKGVDVAEHWHENTMALTRYVLQRNTPAAASDMLYAVQLWNGRSIIPLQNTAWTQLAQVGKAHTKPTARHPRLLVGSKPGGTMSDDDLDDVYDVEADTAETRALNEENGSGSDTDDSKADKDSDGSTEEDFVVVTNRTSTAQADDDDDDDDARKVAEATTTATIVPALPLPIALTQTTAAVTTTATDAASAVTQTAAAAVPKLTSASTAVVDNTYELGSLRDLNLNGADDDGSLGVWDPETDTAITRGELKARRLVAQFRSTHSEEDEAEKQMTALDRRPLKPIENRRSARLRREATRKSTPTASNANDAGSSSDEEARDARRAQYRKNREARTSVPSPTPSSGSDASDASDGDVGNLATRLRATTLSEPLLSPRHRTPPPQPRRTPVPPIPTRSVAVNPTQYVFDPLTRTVSPPPPPATSQLENEYAEMRRKLKSKREQNKRVASATRRAPRSAVMASCITASGKWVKGYKRAIKAACNGNGIVLSKESFLKHPVHALDHTHVQQLIQSHVVFIVQDNDDTEEVQHMRDALLRSEGLCVVVLEPFATQSVITLRPSRVASLLTLKFDSADDPRKLGGMLHKLDFESSNDFVPLPRRNRGLLSTALARVSGPPRTKAIVLFLNSEGDTLGAKMADDLAETAGFITVAKRQTIDNAGFFLQPEESWLSAGRRELLFVHVHSSDYSHVRDADIDEANGGMITPIVEDFACHVLLEPPAAGTQSTVVLEPSSDGDWTVALSEKANAEAQACAVAWIVGILGQTEG